ncbi:TetR/AcrR family transcriptional regulator [Dictyoglomus thermophilum]|uniref:Transcriptional regulator, TetR family n=2 Tax=Dictyoglomus thermophilum TaxID=14 RepID=B5YB02_DICT6|nr:TetR/AcrR family transcriptional regulator [Dictyoglomus thermophilum]ACI19096.1 transcriptional regulator, TetR family [Dictyoglomus thermophilum H-6-12]MCX7721154.1 TetR/AcrR family transcriptional regulator [Dictyoglomus thermophilum]TYT21071.1 TetR/AcrR family transcriptional regulator [Dictyoglomus thermophilum]
MRISKDPEVRRQELVETALKLFLTKGYENTSVRDILREIKGSPGMFYYYFSSKEEIFEEAIKYYVENYIKELSHIFKDENLSLQEKYQKVVNAVVKAFEDMKSLSDIYYSPQYFPLRVKISFRILDSLQESFRELIDKIKKDKNLDSQRAATFILYGVYGLLHKDAEKLGEPKVIQNIMDFILDVTSKVLGLTKV